MRHFLFILGILFFSLQANAQGYQRISIYNSTIPDSFKIQTHRMQAPTSTFLNERGKSLSVKDFKGKVLILNIWTTSCPQCVVELPMLDRLQKDMGSIKFEVIALSSDLESLASLRHFFGQRGIKNLSVYADTQALFAKAADVRGLPTTFLIDANGRIAGRIKGMTEWDGPKIKAQIRQLIKESKPKQKTAPTVILPEQAKSQTDIKDWFHKK